MDVKNWYSSESDRVAASCGTRRIDHFDVID